MSGPQRRPLDLLDTLLELAPEARAQRLAELARAEPTLHGEVAALLEADAAVGPLERQPVSLLGECGAVGDACSDDRVGQRIGPWRITGVVGRGGMGAVYRAERSDGEFRQQAAIKLIRLGMDLPGARARFCRERQILAACRHPNIATLLDGGVTESGAPYFAMELVEGQPIDRWCDARKLGPRDRVRLFLQVCAAVQHAHRNLVVHRDLKPGNVLVDDEGRVRLLDFGIAKLIDEADGDTAQTRDRPFTPDYAAPEQLTGGAITTATDVFALGSMLHLLLTGATPDAAEGPAGQTGGEEPVSASRAAARADPAQAEARGFARPAQLARALRGDLDAVARRCLQHDPAQRYPAVDSLAADLQAWLHGMPVPAARPRRLYRMGKFIGRHRLGVAAGVAALAAFCAASAVALWQAHESRAQAVLATRHALRAEESAAQARAARDFMVGMFRGANPLAHPDGRRLSAVDLLQGAAARIDTELQDAPLARAEVRSAIGKSLFDVGDTRAGVAMMRQGVAEMVAAGGGARNLADMQQSLASSLRALGEHAAAERVARQGLAVLEAAGDECLQCRIRLRTTLANAANQRGDPLSALGQNRAILADRMALLGDADIAVAVDWNNLGNAHLRLGRFAEAERAFERGAALVSTHGGRDHPRMAWLHLGLASARQAQAGRLGLAADSLDEAERVLSLSLGADHPMMAPLAGLRARLALRQGRHEQAAAGFQRALDITAATGVAKENEELQVWLGTTRLEQGRLEEAERLLTAAMTGFERRAATRRAAYGLARAGRGLARAQLGRRAEGELEIRRALAQLRESGHGHSEAHAEAASYLATLLAASDRPGEADRWRRRAHAMFTRVNGRDHPRTLREAALPTALAMSAAR